MGYSAPFLDWTVDELKAIDRRTRKLLTMHTYFSQCKLISIEECVENSMLGLREFVENSNERLIRAANDWYVVS